METGMDKNIADAGYNEFCNSARSALEHEVEYLLHTAPEDLSSLESTWHPSGFAVFPLKNDHELGNLRLHIWPETSRVIRPGNAPIHTHIWHLCSRILTGTYSETLYNTSVLKSGNSREHHSASIDYLVDRNSLTTPGKEYLEPFLTTNNVGGDFHSVPAGVPHETFIEEKSFVATLLFTSHPVLERATMYSPDEIRSSSYDRPTVGQKQKLDLLRRLEHELSISAS